MSPESYKTLLEKNIHKEYKKSTIETVDHIEKEDAEIAKLLDIEDRVHKTSKKEAFITNKDHKDNFKNNPQCRLINPTKQELGKAAKKVIEELNVKLKKVTNHNQWKNDSEVIDWFVNQKQKHSKNFVQWDIDSFYPSITEELLQEALDWAETLLDI